MGVTAVVIGVIAAVMVAAAGAAEAWARGRGLEAARAQLATRLGVSRLELDVVERPVLVALLRRAGTHATIRAQDVPVGDDGRLRDLTATLEGVRVLPRSRTVETGPGSFTAVIEERELDSIVRLPGVVARLELGADGLRVWTILGVAVDAEVIVTDGGLRVVPDAVQVAPLLRLPGVGAFRRVVEDRGLLLELPPLPFDATIEELRFQVGAVTATGTLPEQRLPLVVRAAGGRVRPGSG